MILSIGRRKREDPNFLEDTRQFEESVTDRISTRDFLKGAFLYLRPSASKHSWNALKKLPRIGEATRENS